MENKRLQNRIWIAVFSFIALSFWAYNYGKDAANRELRLKQEPPQQTLINTQP